MPGSIAQLETIFRSHKLRLTTPRRQVFEALQRAAAPLGVATIAGQCPGVDRVSIYRTIEVFVRLGIAAPVTVGWKQRYELTGSFQAHHHHLYCTRCQALIDIESTDLEQLIAHITARHHFRPLEHKFEISGLCHHCQLDTPEPTF